MEVILLERIGKLGQMGDVVRVKDGYARNFLLPRGKALRATADNKSKFEGMKAELQTRNLELKGEAGKLAGQGRRQDLCGDPAGERNRPVVRLGVDPRHCRPAQCRRRRGQPLACRAQRADQVDRPVQGAAGAASGSRGGDHRHRRAQRGRSRAHRARRGRHRAAHGRRRGSGRGQGERGSLLRAGGGQGAAREARSRPATPKRRRPTATSLPPSAPRSQKRKRRGEA